MGTYIETVAEVKTSDGWKTNTAEVFAHPIGDWDTVTKDRRPFIERPFYWQSYGMMGLFAGIRNDSQVKVLASPRGLPEDSDESSIQALAPYGHRHDDYGWGLSGSAVPEAPRTVAQRVLECREDLYGHSWLSAAELIGFDYDQTLIDQSEVPPEVTTYREFLGALYFQHVDALKKLGGPSEVRILFCFNG